MTSEEWHAKQTDLGACKYRTTAEVIYARVTHTDEHNGYYIIVAADQSERIFLKSFSDAYLYLNAFTIVSEEEWQRSMVSEKIENEKN
jgi:hypothetical protein